VAAMSHALRSSTGLGAYEEQVLRERHDGAGRAPGAGRTRIVGTPVRLSTPPAWSCGPRPPGSAHDEILEELGYPPERIAMLRETEVI